MTPARAGAGKSLSGAMVHDNKEIEVRFLDIGVAKLKERLMELGATDLGEDLFKEVIFYDQAGSWQYKEKKFVRLRQTKKGTLLAYKNQSVETATGAEEIEFKIDDFEKAKLLLERIGLVAYREQEKKRQTYMLGEVIVDIDTWPKVPTYVELEGPSEDALKEAAAKLKLNWTDVVFEAPRFVIEKRYKIPFSKLHYFTFDKVE